MTIKVYYYFIILLGLLCSCNTGINKETIEKKENQLKALIIDGENNHGIWPKTTMMMKEFLEETGMFRVDISRKAYTWQGGAHNVKDLDSITQLLTMFPLKNAKYTIVREPQEDPAFAPNFAEYDVIISNLGWKATDWPEKTKQEFENYMKNGGGLVVIHAANNSFGNWQAYNDMIGIGGWGGRNTASGPYVYYDTNEKLQYDPSEGGCGSHGPQSEFLITNRAPEHPIMEGLPSSWMHAKDELYERLRGPAKNMTVLATAFSAQSKNPDNGKITGTNRHEPMLSAIEYGKGRIFHSALGHMDYSMEGLGFIVTLQRGTEWAATGKVTQEVPSDLTEGNAISVRKWDK
jgi:type 1 glutamine amidotransferase